ncbi:hypothetical protein DFS34DRAFT_595511 [Phlyctochytrium arcticum]|nr:hypothetical protein DFS34DRAFT_595511 [Phlyctochytrium arcticum]
MGLSTWSFALGINPQGTSAFSSALGQQAGSLHVAPAAECGSWTSNQPDAGSPATGATPTDGSSGKGRGRQHAMKGTLSRAQDEILDTIEDHVVKLRTGMLRRESLENRCGHSLNILTLMFNSVLSHPFVHHRYTKPRPSTNSPILGRLNSLGASKRPRTSTSLAPSDSWKCTSRTAFHASGHQLSLFTCEYLLSLTQHLFLLPRWSFLERHEFALGTINSWVTDESSHIQSSISFIITYPLHPNYYPSLLPALTFYLCRQTIHTLLRPLCTPSIPSSAPHKPRRESRASDEIRNDHPASSNETTDELPASYSNFYSEPSHQPDFIPEESASIHSTLDQATLNLMTQAMYYGDDAKHVMAQLKRTALRRYWRSAAGTIIAALVATATVWPIEYLLGYAGGSWKDGFRGLVGECLVGWGVLEAAWWITWGVGTWLERS